MSANPRPLRDVQVIDCTTGIAGPYCTKLFADAGEDGATFRFLNAGKRSIIGAFADARTDALLAGADLLVEDLEADAIDIAACRARHPHLVIVSITPYGRSGPLAGASASDLTLQAASGAIGFKGRARERARPHAGRDRGTGGGRGHRRPTTRHMIPPSAPCRRITSLFHYTIGVS